MINLQTNYPLAPLTTFKIGGPAKFFVIVNGAAELVEALTFAKKEKLKVLLLGGGSNMLISDKGFDGLVISINILGLDRVKEDAETVEIIIGAGEIWDKVVDYAVANNYWGIENLSYIPGKVGALAVQNVGAYGQEASQVIDKVEVYDSKTGQVIWLNNKDCGFSYRSSIFNTSAKGRFFILKVSLRLFKTPRPSIAYPDLQKILSSKVNIKLSDIRQTIIKVRNAKFPYPYDKEAKGSAGSFFKNFILTKSQYNDLENNIRKNLPTSLTNLVSIKNKFPVGNQIKIPAAFILEICGVKGLSVGGAKINESQPLVILNDNSQATASEVLSLVKQVREIVKKNTGLVLQLEPALIGFNKEELLFKGFNEEEISKYIN